PTVLQALERIHSPESARLAFGAARRAGFDDVNLDLIYGAHGETLDAWQRTLAEAVERRPEHLSCYALTIEPATQLGRRVWAGALPVGREEQLTAEEQRMEALLLGLRVSDGVPVGLLDPTRVAFLVSDGLAQRRHGRVALTDRGMLLANEVILALDDSSCILV